MNRFLLIWMISFLGIGMSELPAQADLFSKAERFYQAQQYRLALDLFTQLDTTVENLTKRAFCEYRLGQFKSSKETFQRILFQDSMNLTAISQLGSIYDQEYNLPKAIKYYRLLLTIDSTNSYYYKVNGLIHKKAGLITEAFRYFAQARAINDFDITVIKEIAEIFMATEQLVEADSILQIAYQLDSQNLQTILTYAKAKYQQKDYSETVRLLEKTRGWLDLNPYYSKLFGYAYLQIDSFDLAIRELQRLLRSESNEYTHYYLATAYSKKEDWEQAMHHYELAIEDAISPNLFIYYANQAEILADQNQKVAAIKSYAEAFRYSENPKYLFYQAQLADEYYKDKSMAIRVYQRYLRNKPQQEDWIRYAKQRVRYLKEYNHQTKS